MPHRVYVLVFLGRFLSIGPRKSNPCHPPRSEFCFEGAQEVRPKDDWFGKMTLHSTLYTKEVAIICK